MTVRRVLVVEDDDSIREMVSLSLQDAGYRVFDARDGELAMELLEQAAPDVVVVDLRMPLMDGFEFMRRYTEGGGRAPIIVLSAARDVDLAQRKIPAVAVLEKPFDLNDLLNTVERVAPIG